MDSNWDLEGWERGIAPSVSKDRWIAHARTKLSRGYALIVNETRRNANFFKAGRGYEACRYTVAIALVRAGTVVPAGRHALGTLYLLSPEAAAVPIPLRKPDADEDEPTLAADDALLALTAPELAALTDPDVADADLTGNSDEDALENPDEEDAAPVDPLDALFDGASFLPNIAEQEMDPGASPQPRRRS